VEGEDGASESGDGSSESQETAEVQVSPHITNDKLTSYDALESTLTDRKSTRLNSSHSQQSRMPSSA